MKLLKILFLTAILAIAPLTMTNAEEITAATKATLIYKFTRKSKMF